MNILEELENFINEFNELNDIDFAIDSIRIEFSKQYKLEKLHELGNWNKLQKNSNILYKLKNRLSTDEVTSAYRFEKEDIYYYNMRDATKKYRQAELVIFGMKQYHKVSPPRNIIAKILSILKNVSNIDICFDMKQEPNIKALSSEFDLKQFVFKNGVFTSTYYINSTLYEMIEKVIIYDKAYKNKLEGILYRIEAKILIPNINVLALPLHDFKHITNLARLSND